MSERLGTAAAIAILLLAACVQAGPPAADPTATTRPPETADTSVPPVTVEELLTLPAEGELPTDVDAAIELEAGLVRQTVLASLREPRAARLLADDAAGTRAEQVADAFAEAMREMARARHPEEPDTASRADARWPEMVACVPSLDGPPCPDDPADAEGYDDYATNDKDVDVAVPDGCVTQTAKLERQDWLKDGRKGLRHYTLLEISCEDGHRMRDETTRWGEAQACPGPEGQVPGEIRTDRVRDITMAVEGGTLTGRIDATASGLMQVHTNDEAEFGGFDAASINWRYEPRGRVGDGPEDGASFGGRFSLSDMSFEPGTAEQLAAEVESGESGEGASGFMADFLEWMTAVVVEASNHWKTSGNCVVLTVTEGQDPPVLRGGESHAFRLEASHREGGQLDVQVEVIGTALNVASVTPGGKVTSPAAFTYTAAPASVREGNYRDTVAFITKSKRGIGRTDVGVAVDAQQGSYDLLYEYEATGGEVPAVSFTIHGRLDPDDSGDWSGVGTIEGTFWKAWDGGYDYCVPYPLTGTIDLIAVELDGEVHVMSGSSAAELDGEELWAFPGPGGFGVPLSTLTAMERTLARDSDEVDGSCFAFANVTETITLTER